MFMEDYETVAEFRGDNSHKMLCDITHRKAEAH